MKRCVKNESKHHLFDKLDANDVWKDFNCPKYIPRACYRTDKLTKDFNNQFDTNINYILRKLDELISDPVTSNSTPRICRLLYEYLHEVGDNGYKVKDLPTVIKILPFLARNVKSVKEYELYLDQMLGLCNLTPLLEKYSENLIIFDIMEQYFTLLGHLLEILPTNEQILKVHEALHSLLLRTHSTNVATVKLEYCHRVMEKSKLPISVTNLLKVSVPSMYQKVLELIFLLSSISYTCSHRMLEAGVLDTILIRFDLPYATQLRCTRPPDALISGAEYSEDMTFLIINTLWNLMKSVLPPNNISIDLKNTLTCVQCGLW
ncbi:uncharacterized protein LOC143340711 [Colletes latitarsis]|uniref:uncharacterized protein LOC143340711 n=1 Tax=Colletes latitarsis TaxID=2605962 RepID=UPI004035553E